MSDVATDNVAGGDDIVSIEVVAAVIEAGNRFLLTRRQAGVHLEGLWEFPGGKIEPGESHAEALRRELREELDADVDVHELVLQTTHEYPDRTVTLYFHRCVLRGVPRPMLGQAMRWVVREDLTTLGLPPADAELIRLLTGSDLQ
ncbi:MAG: (deoxy)nucleoside triphosphate pyrophosphohydrolase [Acidobacteria bacterium]|nr:(deoxy)nucleoside triphosphate pyrophosphohydrolase [Acidobacteriota bacterium]